MFVDDVSGIGLWGGGALSLSAELVTEVQAWVDDWTKGFQAPDFDEESHDWRGHALSLRVQDELGVNYQVTFMPQSRAVQDALDAEPSD